MTTHLYRSREDRMLAGVAGGLAELWDADPSLVRIIWALLVVLTGGIALVGYIVMAIVVPEEDGSRSWGSASSWNASPPSAAPPSPSGAPGTSSTTTSTSSFASRLSCSATTAALSPRWAARSTCWKSQPPHSPGPA